MEYIDAFHEHHFGILNINKCIDMDKTQFVLYMYDNDSKFQKIKGRKDCIFMFRKCNDHM